MRWLRGMAAATAALAVALGAMVVTTSSAAAEPAGCIGQDALGNDDVLQPGKALCNGPYQLWMQPNGDLVLRDVSDGGNRVCWHSNTFKPASVATVRANADSVTLMVDDKVIDKDTSGEGVSVNLNRKGQLWVGFNPKASC
jgi:hypothetical protein